MSELHARARANAETNMSSCMLAAAHVAKRFARDFNALFGSLPLQPNTCDSAKEEVTAMSPKLDARTPSSLQTGALAQAIPNAIGHDLLVSRK